MPHDDQSELFYHVDKDDKVLGSITRAQAHSDNTLIHRAVQIVLTNSKNQTLMQKRSKNKDLLPGFWTVSASGHVTYGETYQQAAHKELTEELGIDTKLTFVTKHTVKDVREYELDALFTGKYHSTPNNFDSIEIDEVKWVDISKLSNFISKHKVTANAKYSFKSLSFI